MKYVIAILLVAAMVACAPPEPTPEPTPVAPPPEPEPVEEVPDVEELDPEPMPDEGNLEEVLDVGELEIITEDDVTCSNEDSVLEFTFRNNGEKSWELNQNVPFPAPSDLAAVDLVLNGYEMNKKTGTFINGERMFGPAEKFSDNCGGVEVLAPGEEAHCFLQPVPLDELGAWGDAQNEIIVNAPGADGNVRFTCG